MTERVHGAAGVAVAAPDGVHAGEPQRLYGATRLASPAADAWTAWP
jgi:hypothetical protein